MFHHKNSLCVPSARNMIVVAQISGSDMLPLVQVLLLGVPTGVKCIGDDVELLFFPLFFLGHPEITMKTTPVAQARMITMKTTVTTINNSRYDTVWGDAGSSLGGVGTSAAELRLLTALTSRPPSVALVAVEEPP